MCYTRSSRCFSRSVFKQLLMVIGGDEAVQAEVDRMMDERTKVVREKIAVIDKVRVSLHFRVL